MKRMRAGIAGAAAALALSLLSLSCGGGAAEDGSVVLEFMMWGAPDELDTVKGYLRQFQAENPGIRIRIIHKNQYDQALMTYFAGGNPPDVMYLGLERFSDYASRGQLLELGPYVARDSFPIGDFYPQLVRNFQWQGRLYGIPKDFTPLVLYYNKDMFRQAGVPFPDGTWTWDTFLAASRKLTRDFDGDGIIDQYGFTVETWLGEWYPWVVQNGGQLISDDGKEWLLGDPRYIDRNAEALQFLADLMGKERVSPNASVTRDREPSAIFKAGRAAMCTYGRWMCMQFKDIKEFDWDVAVLPYRARRASTLFVVSYAIASASEHPEEAWKLVKFLTGPAGQVSTARTGLAVPVTRSVAESPDFLEAAAIPQRIDARVFLDSIDGASPTPTVSQWSRMQEILDRELQYVWEGRRPAREVLEEIQPEIQAILSGRE